MIHTLFSLVLCCNNSIGKDRDGSQTPSACAGKISEALLVSMREEYMQWSVNSDRHKPPMRASIEEAYIHTKKEVQRTKHLLRIHQISDNGLFQFRRFSHQIKPVVVEVTFEQHCKISAICSTRVRCSAIVVDRLY